MHIFNTINSKDITIKKYGAYSNIRWQFVSSSTGMDMLFPESASHLVGAIWLNRAKTEVDYAAINVDTNLYEHSIQASVKHLFYDNKVTFISASRLTTQSLVELSNNNYVVSVGQNLYGNRIKPGTFELIVDEAYTMNDDSNGYLFVSQSGTGYNIGNIFYDKGIAVITQNTSSIASTINQYGMKIVSGTQVDLSYKTDVEWEQHQINVRIPASEFNFSPFNPTTKYLYSTTGSVTQSFEGITPIEENSWAVYNLMGSGFIRPYVTTIGLYNDQYELLAVAKVSTPIQRTFDAEQIFIIRFDLDYTFGE